MKNTITDIVKTVSFSVFFDPPLEIQRGFCEVINVEFNDYGEVPEDEDQFYARIQFRGRDKTRSGKPDKRSRDRGLIGTRITEEAAVIAEVLKDRTEPELIMIREHVAHTRCTVEIQSMGCPAR